MRGASIIVDNGRRFAVATRSGSYAIIWQSLPASLRVPVEKPNGERWHPLNSHPNAYSLNGLTQAPAEGLCCLVRDPVERFRSACARQGVSVEEGLTALNSDVHFWPLESMGLLTEGVTHFRFPGQINDCAEWLGLETPVPQRNAEPEENKPTLTPEQEAAVRVAYSADVALWESLQS
jgi:hypothetical protein